MVARAHSETQDPRVLMSMLRLRGMQGKTLEAERLFSRIADMGGRVTRTNDVVSG